MKILEGTPEELFRYEQLQAGKKDDGHTAAIPPTPSPFDEGKGGNMSTEVAFRCLSRDPELPETVHAIVALLHEKKPKLISGVELAKHLNLSIQQLTGVFGAFGRRCANTEGFVSQDWKFFQYAGRPGDWSYGLTEQSAAAVAEYLKRRG